MSIESPKNQRSVASYETEGVGHGVAHGQRAGGYWNEVEAIIDVRTFEIDCRGCDLVAKLKNGEAGFETPCASEEMAGHGLGGTDGQSAGVISEGGADGGCFGTVAEQRRSRVRVEIGDIGRQYASIRERQVQY